jgi:hypothetical protein
MNWTYSQVEAGLCSLFGIDPRVRTKAFRGRIQHLQKLGIPLGLKPGRGRKICYQDEHVFQWVIAIQLMELGVHPTALVNTLAVYWEYKLLNAFRLASGAPGSDKDDDVLVAFSPRLLSVHNRSLGEPTILRGVADLARMGLRSEPGYVILNVSEVVRRLRLLRDVYDHVVAAEPRPEVTAD